MLLPRMGLLTASNTPQSLASISSVEQSSLGQASVSLLSVASTASVASQTSAPTTPTTTQSSTTQSSATSTSVSLVYPTSTRSGGAILTVSFRTIPPSHTLPALVLRARLDLRLPHSLRQPVAPHRHPSQLLILASTSHPATLDL